MSHFYLAVSWWFGVWGVCLRAGLLALLCKLPGEREQVNIVICIFFSCLCTQISPQKTVGVQSSENQECLFLCFLVFIKEMLRLYFLITEHSHVGLFLLIMRWSIHNCHRKTFAPVYAFWPDCKLTWPHCASWALHKKLISHSFAMIRDGWVFVLFCIGFFLVLLGGVFKVSWLGLFSHFFSYSSFFSCSVHVCVFVLFLLFLFV